jgi:F-type H+-transporting ATPase subunit delta
MARQSSAARRYAEAAFELATRDDALDAWMAGLETAAGIFSEANVAPVIHNPAVPLRDRVAIVARLLDGRVPPSVASLSRLLVERGKSDRLPAVAAEYRRLLNRARGVVEATVTSATPLSPAETDALRAKIAGMTGHTVDLTLSVDDALIGGLTVRVGDTLYDASVRGRLERLREQLVAGSR